MDRDIKFRAWLKNEKKMIDVWWYDGCYILQRFFTGFTVAEIKHHRRDSVLMQFTGLKDFNDKEIYEGDIFIYNYTLDGTQTRIKKVEFNKEVGAWYLGGDLLSTVLIEQNNDDWKKSQNYKIRDNQYLRISGNIFQNPELFESTQQSLN
jgi:uncharacterized phage protein (TIGR01671 family)